MRHFPRLLIAGTHSGVGKTTLSTAIMAALTGKGYIVQPYKVGPDYIDPGYHNAATGRISRNLDAWMMGEEAVRESFARSSRDAGLSIIEGVMGLYDGLGSAATGSSAHVAKVLNCPVVLVLDVRSMARSAAAVVLGYSMMDPGLNLAGVILNRVGSRRHYLLVKEAIEETCRIPVLGYVPRQAEIELPERHLGLLPSFEKGGLQGHITKMAAALEEGIDLEQLVELARAAGPHSRPARRVIPDPPFNPRARLGFFYDEAFNFYYRDGLDLLAGLGAELVRCSPLHDARLPQDLHGLYIGGGFPEMFLELISANEGFRQDLKAASDSGLPVYAECGGLMYLTQRIADFTGGEYPAAGVIEGFCRMEKKRAALGYVNATVINDNILTSRGTVLRGHEFHYSTLYGVEGSRCAYRLNKAGVELAREEGTVLNNVLASYVHLHFCGCPEAAAGFIDSCERYKENLF